MQFEFKPVLKWILALVCVCTFGDKYSYGSEEANYLQTAVSGTVVSHSDGLLLPRVTVQVKDTGNGVAKDFDGNYEIEVSTMDAVLVFSYVGFKTCEVPVNNQTTINVCLEDDKSLLDEVMFIGYRSRKRATLTGGSISVVKPA